jgi:hypothetical protein
MAGPDLRFQTKDPESLPPVHFYVDDEAFECIRTVPGQLLLNYSRASNQEAAQATHEFLDVVVLDSDKKRWDARLADHKRPIDLGLLVQIVEGLVEYYADLPTTPPSDTPAPRRRTGSGTRAQRRS